MCVFVGWRSEYAKEKRKGEDESIVARDKGKLETMREDPRKFVKSCVGSKVGHGSRLDGQSSSSWSLATAVAVAGATTTATATGPLQTAHAQQNVYHIRFGQDCERAPMHRERRERVGIALVLWIDT